MTADHSFGYVLTASHVVTDEATQKPHKRITCWFPRGRAEAYVVDRVSVNKPDPNGGDLALVAIPRPEQVSSRTVLFRKPEVGDRICVFGFGNPDQGAVSVWGRVTTSAVNDRNGYTDSYVYFLPWTRVGDSGGAICDEAGNVIGVIGSTENQERRNGRKYMLPERDSARHGDFAARLRMVRAALPAQRAINCEDREMTDLLGRAAIAISCVGVAYWKEIAAFLRIRKWPKAEQPETPQPADSTLIVVNASIEKMQELIQEVRNVAILLPENQQVTLWPRKRGRTRWLASVLHQQPFREHNRTANPASQAGGRERPEGSRRRNAAMKYKREITMAIVLAIVLVPWSKVAAILPEIELPTPGPRLSFTEPRVLGIYDHTGPDSAVEVAFGRSDFTAWLRTVCEYRCWDDQMLLDNAPPAFAEMMQAGDPNCIRAST